MALIKKAALEPSLFSGMRKKKSVDHTKEHTLEQYNYVLLYASGVDMKLTRPIVDDVIAMFLP
jgi:hypothetical protein